MHLIFKYIIKYIGMLFFSAQAEYSNLIFCWFHPENILVLFLDYNQIKKEFVIIFLFFFFAVCLLLLLLFCTV